MSDVESALDRLSNRLGILPAYLDYRGQPHRASDETWRAIVAAMGIDATTDARAIEALRALESWDAERVIDPSAVVVHDDPACNRLHVNASSVATTGRWRLDVEREGHDGSASTDGSWHSARFAIDIPEPLARGYHTLRLILSHGGREHVAIQRRIIVPPTCVTVHELLGRVPTPTMGSDPNGDRRAFGVGVNLYSVRSARNWGVGDLTDLESICRWVASIGGAFVGINPLHATANRGDAVGPYSPISRLFRNPLYLDAERVLEGTSIAKLEVVDEALRGRLNALRSAPRVPYEAAMSLKETVLAATFDAWRHAPEEMARRRELIDYQVEHEPWLTNFATFAALAEHLRERNPTGDAWQDWRRWPEELRDSRSATVRRFQEQHADRIAFHRWLQFELDRQLGVVARSARDGLDIGLYQDLALGTVPDGADTWAYPEVFAAGASIGAPPDPYTSSGQCWNLAPLDPRALSVDGYRYVAHVARNAFRHSGALRIDHVMGLFRQFWVPDGMTAADGAYVRYPAEDLLGIIALESERARAIVVGEDLGTVPPEVRPALERWKILSSRVLFFERTDTGFRSASSYPRNAVAMATTHDMIPLAGYATGRDIEIRQEIGVLTPAGAREARQGRARELESLVQCLREGEAAASAEHPTPSIADFRRDVHAFICRTPSALAQLALDDLAGETDPVNVPGASAADYPSWTRKMHRTIEELGELGTRDAGIAVPQSRAPFSSS